MRLVLQRVRSASVRVNGGQAEKIGKGLVILAGIAQQDNEKIAKAMADKAVNLRIFEDENAAMNRSLLDVAGDVLVVSNFTLYANCRKGRRPSFIEAAAPDYAKQLYEYFVHQLRECGVNYVQDGCFGADMLVELINDGPVTIILDSKEVLPG